MALEISEDPTVSEGIEHRSSNDDVSEEEAYDVEDRDQNEFDDEKEEMDEIKNDKKEEAQIGEKRKLENKERDEEQEQPPSKQIVKEKQDQEADKKPNDEYEEKSPKENASDEKSEIAISSEGGATAPASESKEILKSPEREEEIKTNEETSGVHNEDQESENDFEGKTSDKAEGDFEEDSKSDRRDGEQNEDGEDEGEDEEDDEEENEENEEEEDDEEEGEERGNRNQSKKRRRRANQFIDIEAEVDDEEEDELDEDDEEAELLREQFIADDNRLDGNEEEQNQDDRLHRQFDRRLQDAEDQDAEELAETLKQRYRKTHSVYRGDTMASGAVSQKLLMPSINDPPIYTIRCTPGREKDLVRKLYAKKRTLERLKNPLEILTVFQRDAFRGYIYIEAKKPEAIERALAGMVNVYAKQRLLVPVREYPDLLKQVKSSDVEIVPGIYVRITRGKYKGDLALVDNLSENGLDVRCKLVPRLDYGKNTTTDKEGRRIVLKIKPPPRLFSEQDARMFDAQHLQPGRGPRSFIYRGEEYIDGFLFKDFKLQFIQTKDVHPRLDELDRFHTGDAEEDGFDLSNIAASLKNSKSENNQSGTFQPGDKVEICRGEQARTMGKVHNISLNEVTIVVTDSGDYELLGRRLTVPANDIRKVFAIGDHVRVVEGKHADETGLVIQVDEESVILISDQMKQDIKVFANYLVKATEVSLNADITGGGFELKDLVQLNAATVGVVVKAEKGLFEIITSDGRLISTKPSGVAGKVELSRREQVATDKSGSTIKIGDTVKEAFGDKKREGVVLHIYKNSLFIKLNEILENLGIFVTNCMNVSTVASKDSMVSKTFGPDLTRMNPNVKTPNHGANAALRFKSNGREKILGHDIIINGGNYKGLIGKVKDTDDVFARIELQSTAKIVKVNKNSISVLVKGESIPYLRFIGSSAASQGPNSFNNQGRSWGPAFSSAKPSWGSNGGMTPAVGGGASTWGGNGGASSWGGGKTPGYNAGKGSAWGDGGASTWRGNGNSSTWGGGSSWGGKGGNKSLWGNASTWGGARNGASSTWGGASNWGGASTWGESNKGNKKSWSNNSTWGSK